MGIIPLAFKDSARKDVTKGHKGKYLVNSRKVVKCLMDAVDDLFRQHYT